MGSPLEPLPSLGTYVPDELDHAAHDVAAAALRDDTPAVAASLHTLKDREKERRRRGERASGLVAPAQHVRDAALADREAYRRATQTLLERHDVDPALRHVLEQELADDPLRLAEQRLRDARRGRFARIFNTLAAPLGRSLLSAWLAPYRLGRALIQLGVQARMEDPISVPERQALVHWKRYLDANPEDVSPEMLRRVKGFQRRWLELKRKRSLDAARTAFEKEQYELAFVLADRALHYAPEDETAEALRERAQRAFEQRRAERQRSLEPTVSAPPEATDPGARGLALALLLPGTNLTGAAESYLAGQPQAPLAEVARFALASARREAGDERGLGEELRALAALDPAQSFMARHAAALLQSSEQNPFAAFETARRHERRARTGWVVLGPLARGPRQMDLPRPLEWLIDAPTFLEGLTGLPNRLVRVPWMPPQHTAAATYARRYLARFPQGEHAVEVRRWLIDFEKARGNAVEAHRLASEEPEFPPERLADLAEAAARQGLATAQRQKRTDLRLDLLRYTARHYAETTAGREAGHLAREALGQVAAQRIRISRGFLRENPEVAGPAALGLQGALLDGDTKNGELHPDGVLLLGGRTLELSFVNESGREEDLPRRVRRNVSEERLARIVSRLDETALRNALTDSAATIEPDADRDLFFERARLGTTAHTDRRPTAQSTYAFRGVRERYGMVRKRESLLPVELVLQGSLPDLGLGAFPRLRMPKPTPDAILYQ